MEEVANRESIETCVEMEFAEFSKQINDLLLSAEEIKVCYLAVIGLRNSEISALMNVYASTITRRMQTLSKKGVLFPLGNSEELRHIQQLSASVPDILGWHALSIIVV